MRNKDTGNNIKQKWTEKSRTLFGADGKIEKSVYEYIAAPPTHLA